MSLNDILGTATSGLAAAQAGLRTVSNNIANVGTSGYARERVNLSASVVQGRVTGVSVGEPTRIADRFLEETVFRRAGDQGQAAVEESYLSRLQSLLGQPGASTGMSARLDAVMAAATEMTGVRNGHQTVAVFTGEVQSMIDTLRQLDSDAQGITSDVSVEIGESVDRVNSLLTQIDDLNGTVARLQGLGRSSAGVADERNKAIEELGGLIKVNVRSQPDGRVQIETATGISLLDNRLRQLSYTPGGNDGISQPTASPIMVHFAGSDAVSGAATGQRIDTAATGGKLGGLIALRDEQLPAFSEKLATLFRGFAETVNRATNASTTVPAPQSMTGRPSGLTSSDRMGFTGSTIFAVTDATGVLVASSTVNFDALGADATLGDMLSAINAGLGGAATASLDASGTLTLSATDRKNGVVVAQGTPPGERTGAGFSHYFGLNDLIRSDAGPLVPSGFTTSDLHGFGTGESANIELRNATGKVVASHVLTGTTGATMGDLVAELNGSDLGNFGSFALDDKGRFQFTAKAASSGAQVAITSDSTNRAGTGISFSALSGLSSATSLLQTASLRPDMANDPARFPVATFQTGASVGQKALGSGDVSGATQLVTILSKSADFGAAGMATLNGFAATLVSKTGLEAAHAATRLTDASARMTDAVNRRDNFSGVNLDEELSQMVILQNSYSASARVVSVASQMYETLLNMI